MVPKGLEFPIVFMTGMEEGVFPSYRSESEEELKKKGAYAMWV